VGKPLQISQLKPETLKRRSHAALLRGDTETAQVYDDEIRRRYRRGIEIATLRQSFVRLAERWHARLV
jgi:hypothetical protein